MTLQRLSRNYHALFRHFTLLNLWLSFFDQVMVLAPYFVAAPLLFAEDPAQRITLGTLIQLSNSFDKVFSSMNVIAEAWGQINEFRSVLVRLREFESKIYQHTPAAQRRRGDNTPHCWLLPPDSGAPNRPRRWWQRCSPRRSRAAVEPRTRRASRRARPRRAATARWWCTSSRRPTARARRGARERLALSGAAVEGARRAPRTRFGVACGAVGARRRGASDNPLRGAHLVPAEAHAVPLTFPRPPAQHTHATATAADTSQFNTHPQPRTFAPSKEDVLQKLQYFFGAPVSPEKLKDYSHSNSAPRARKRHPLGPKLTAVVCLRVRSHAVTYHFPDAYVGQNTKSPRHARHPLPASCSSRFVPLLSCSPRHAQQPHPQVAAVVADLGRPCPSSRSRAPSSNGTKCAFDVRLMQRTPLALDSRFVHLC